MKKISYSYTPISQTPYIISPYYALTSSKIYPDRHFFLFLTPNKIYKKIDIIPFLHAKLKPFLPPGFIYCLEPFQIQNKQESFTTNLSTIILQSQNENYTWNLQTHFFFSATNELFFYMDSQPGHLIVHGKNPTLFPIYLNPINLPIDCRRFAYWTTTYSNEFLKQDLFQWQTIYQTILTITKNQCITDMNQMIGKWEAPPFSSLSGITTTLPILPFCGYFIWISGTCIRGNCILLCNHFQKQRILSSNIDTSWKEGEFHEFIIFIPPCDLKELEIGVVAVDHNEYTEFVINQFAILILTEPTKHLKSWELPTNYKSISQLQTISIWHSFHIDIYAKPKIPKPIEVLPVIEVKPVVEVKPAEVLPVLEVNPVEVHSVLKVLPVINSKQENCYLFIPFYLPQNNLQLQNLLVCLHKNLQNLYITHIYLFYDDYKLDTIFQINNLKLSCFYEKPTFQTIFQWIQTHKLEGFIILANPNLYFDSTILNLFQFQVETQKKEPIVYSQNSHNIWIFHSPNIPDGEDIRITGYDNRLNTYLTEKGWIVLDASFYLPIHSISEQQIYPNDLYYLNIPPLPEHCNIYKENSEIVVKQTAKLKERWNLEDSLTCISERLEEWVAIHIKSEISNSIKIYSMIYPNEWIELYDLYLENKSYILLPSKTRSLGISIETTGSITGSILIRDEFQTVHPIVEYYNSKKYWDSWMQLFWDPSRWSILNQTIQTGNWNERFVSSITQWKPEMKQWKEFKQQLTPETQICWNELGWNQYRKWESYWFTWNLRHLPDIWLRGVEWNCPDLSSKNLDQDGVSIVVAFQNQTEEILKHISSWCLHSMVREIILVDWSSDTILELPSHLTKVRIIRVENETTFHYSYAYNWGICWAKYPFILKIDPTISLSENWYGRNPMEKLMYRSGDWRFTEESHSSFYFWSRDYWWIQGFDERINDVATANCDLNNRLLCSGVQRSTLYLNNKQNNKKEINQKIYLPWNRVDKLQTYQIQINTEKYITCIRIK